MKKVVAVVVYILTISGQGVFAQPGELPYVIMVSFDGFRHDYTKLFNAKNFRDFAANGTQADGLIPSFPSKTFPNHYTLVTGLYPGKHGLVDNSFYDPDRKQFYGMKQKERVRDPYYYGGVPIWELARKSNVKSASFFWVGSELPTDERRPDYSFPYDESVADTLRVDQVIAWLALPQDKRPHIITLYFSSPDHESHLYGPESEEARRAVMNADALLARLMTGVKKSGLPVNVLLVSDHGMLALKQQPDSYIFLNEILKVDNPSIKISNSGTQAHIYVNSEKQRDSLYSVLKGRAKKFSVYKQEEFPVHWHYNAVRSGDLLITAHPGFYIQDDRAKFQAKKKSGPLFGAHGYDATLVPQMRGIFIAQGPNIKSDFKMPAFENIHIYPLIAKILRLSVPEDIDGRFEVLEKIYQD